MSTALDFLTLGLAAGALVVGFAAAIALFLGVLWVLTILGVIVANWVETRADR